MTRPDSPTVPRKTVVGVVGAVGIVGIVGAVGAVALTVGLGVGDGAVLRVLRGFRGLLGVMAGRGAGCREDLAGSGLAHGAGWRAMRAAARLMAPAAGRRWLAEAESYLAEAPPGLRHVAVRSYLVSAPQLIAVSWAMAAARRARLTGRGPAAW